MIKKKKEFSTLAADIDKYENYITTLRIIQIQNPNQKGVYSKDSIDEMESKLNKQKEKLTKKTENLNKLNMSLIRVLP